MSGVGRWLALRWYHDVPLDVALGPVMKTAPNASQIAVTNGQAATLKIETTVMTIMRFSISRSDLEALADDLEMTRTSDPGLTKDWVHHRLREYPRYAPDWFAQWENASPVTFGVVPAEGYEFVFLATDEHDGILTIFGELLLWAEPSSSLKGGSWLFVSDDAPPTQSQRPSAPQPAEPPTDRQMIRRAVFLSFLMELSNIEGERDALYFLSLEPGEESDLDTIYGAFRVKSSAECKVDAEHLNVQAKSDRELGYLFEVKRITLSGDTAEVYAGCFPPGALYTFRLQRQDEQWAVVEKVLEVVP